MRGGDCFVAKSAPRNDSEYGSANKFDESLWLLVIASEAKQSLPPATQGAIASSQKPLLAMTVNTGL
jgi:hypothetical protein